MASALNRNVLTFAVVLLTAVLPFAGNAQEEKNSVRVSGQERVASREQLIHAPLTSNYFKSARYKANLIRLGQRLDDDLNHACYDGDENAIPLDIEILETILKRDPEPHPSKGAWKQSYQFTRCGLGSRLNVLVIAEDGGHPRFVPLVPGETEVSPFDQSATLETVFRAAMTKLAGAPELIKCTKASIADTKIRDKATNIKRQDGMNVRRRTIEEWQVYMCGAIARVTVRQDRLWGERTPRVDVMMN